MSDTPIATKASVELEMRRTSENNRGLSSGAHEDAALDKNSPVSKDGYKSHCPDIHELHARHLRTVKEHAGGARKRRTNAFDELVDLAANSSSKKAKTDAAVIRSDTHPAASDVGAATCVYP